MVTVIYFRSSHVATIGQGSKCVTLHYSKSYSESRVLTSLLDPQLILRRWRYKALRSAQQSSVYARELRRNLVRSGTF